MQSSARVGGQSDDIAGVGRYLGLEKYDVKQ